MKKKHQNLLIYFITIFFLIEFMIHSNYLIETFFKTVNLCFYNILPTIFIFFTITDILNNYNFPYHISKLFGKIIEKIYHLPQVSAYIFFMSFSSGFPGNAKLIKEQLEKGNLNEYDATKLLTMTHFSNPLFIIYAVGHNFFHDNKIGLLILIVHFMTNFVIGFFFRNIYKYEKKNINLPINKSLSFIELLKSSFYNTSKLLVNIFGIIIIMAIINVTLNNYLNLNSYSSCIINGLIEMTSGLNMLSLLNIEKTRAIALATFFISFGGFSIHLQVMSILNKYDINYYIYLISRLMHGSLSSIIIYLILTYYK